MTAAGRASMAGGATSLDSSELAGSRQRRTPPSASGNIPLNPGVKADQGVDKSAHDFLQSWVVGKEPNKSVAYFSRRSYPCLEVMAQKSGQPVPPGMIRLRTMMAMQKFSDSTGTVNSVADVFEPADKWSQALKPAKNAYASEFLLVSVPADMAPDEECVATPNDDSSKPLEREILCHCVSRKTGRQPEQGDVPALGSGGRLLENHCHPHRRWQ